MRKSKWFIMLLFLLAVPSVQGADEPPKLPAKQKFHIYLLMGQSNMAGRGEITEADKQPVARVLVLDKDQAWVPAAHPLYFDKPIAGVGLGIDFAQRMLEHAGDDEVMIGLVPTAVGGTSLAQWAPENDATKLYSRAMERAAKAMETGTIKGVLWHQGEGDSGTEELASSYGERLAAFIAHLRRDLGRENLPVVVGELGHFLPAKQPLAAKVNAALNDLPKHVPLTACASAAGLKDKGDGTHFNAAALREFGRRYAAAMLALHKQHAGRKP